MGLICISSICFFFAVKYSIETPDIVKPVAEAFKKSLKDKIKFDIKMKNAENKKKPSDIVLVFFPIVSRTGTDIDAAMKNIGRKLFR